MVLRLSPPTAPMKALIGTTVQSRDGKKIGSVIDAMLRCDAADIAYVVISDAGPIAIEETLRVVAPHQVQLAPQAVTLLLSEAEFLALPAIAADDWPSAVASVRSTA